MREADVARLVAEGVAYVVPLRPEPREFKPVKDVVLGFDVEWDGSLPGKPLVTVQFAAVMAGKVVSRVFDAPTARLSIVDLALLVLQFMREVGLGRRRVMTVRLVAYFAQAELGMFEDALKDARIHKVHKAHHADFEPVDVDGFSVRLCLFDLFAFYGKGGLKAVGKMIGLPKIALPHGAIEHMADYRHREPAAYDAYAARDAEIAVLALVRLRGEMVRFQVDPLRHRTLAGMGAATFRRSFQTCKAAMPFRYDAERRVAFARNCRLRLLALRSLWGGCNVAFGRGLYRGPVKYFDVKGMYTFCAIGQPLPNDRTKFFRWPKGRRFATGGEAVERLKDVEGFAHVEFAFPPECKYPSLPVSHPQWKKLYFPLRGESYCTVVELRIALHLGARIRVLELWGFRPGDSERDHDVRRFMRAFLGTSEDPLVAATNKNLRNTFIGKFAEKFAEDKTTDVERLHRLQGFEGASKLLHSSALGRAALRGPMRAGGVYYPEWNALITGRARAVMACVNSCLRSLITTTDGLKAPGDARVDGCPGVQWLRDVGSDLVLKCDGDALWIGRERMDAVLRHEPDRSWGIVELARHGMTGTAEEVHKDLLACLRVHHDVSPPHSRKRLASASEAARLGTRINDEIIDPPAKTKFRWDAKRRLVNRDVNIFGCWSDTEPYLTIAGALKGDRHRAREAAKVVVRRRKRAKLAVQRAEHLLRTTDMTNGAIAGQTGVSKSWVRKLRQALQRDPVFTVDPAAEDDGGACPP